VTSTPAAYDLIQVRSSRLGSHLMAVPSSASIFGKVYEGRSRYGFTTASTPPLIDRDHPAVHRSPIVGH
jgi:hypothetical protein